MASIEAAVYSLLDGDAGLTAKATGGIWDHEAIEAAGLGRDGLTLKVISGGTPIVQPSVYVSWSTSNAVGPVKLGAKRIFFEVFFYDHAKYSVIREMRQMVYDLLHEQRVEVDAPNWVRQIVHAGDLTNRRDDRLANACFERSRWAAIMVEV